MRYLLTFLFCILLVSNVYANDPDSLPDDPKYGKTSIVDFDDVIVTKVR